MGAKGDLIAHVTFFARAKQVNQFEPYFIPRESNNHIEVMILRLECYKLF